MAEHFAELMRLLGYRHYCAQGGDWGAVITSQLAARPGNSGADLNHLQFERIPSDVRHPESCVALHVPLCSNHEKPMCLAQVVLQRSCNERILSFHNSLAQHDAFDKPHKFRIADVMLSRGTDYHTCCNPMLQKISVSSLQPSGTCV